MYHVSMLPGIASKNRLWGRGSGPPPPTFLVCLSILFPFTLPAIGLVPSPSYFYPYLQRCLSFTDQTLLVCRRPLLEAISPFSKQLKQSPGVLKTMILMVSVFTGS